MKLLSIVIPTYNMQDYLQKCLDSLIVTQHQLSLFEAIVVNDGSKDSSSAIAHEYQERYPGTFRVIDKENGNYGSCVNRGLAEATGKYIRVLDADDYFDTVEFSKFLTALSELKYDVDLVLTDFATVNCSGVITERNENNLDETDIFPFQNKELLCSYYCVHTLSYRTDMLRSIGYRQSEGMFYTDNQWSFIPMHAIDTCIYMPINMYRYLSGRDGQSMDPKVLTRTVSQHIQVTKSLVTYYDYLPTEYRESNVYKRIDREIAVLSGNIYKLCLIEQDSKSFNKSELVEYDRFLKERRPGVYHILDDTTLNGLPFHYIRFWRRTGLRLPLALLRNAVRRIRYGNWRIHYGK